ncbi:ImpA family type VI secretion system protein [Caballeronia sp. INML2]|uniref:type VI secretion system protein TssA n=1 Tax=Caballeronia sp. INML2 TaxID=2921748 RepID=UPI0020291AF0|nr:type VI secretion system ImpA family N-terminal domain-containing protein [Caballeronia sp. INML2]
MSKKRNVTTEAGLTHDWMTPVTADMPCGADPEYDPEFILLFGRVAARTETQYGDFVGTPEPVNWSEIERDCRRLMMRAKDIRLAVLFTRCRTRLAAFAGLAEGLGLLAAWLNAFADTVHPQLGVDEDRDAALEIRMNALQALTDMDGLLADVREIALARSSVSRLQVRDVERAFAQPRPSDALSVDSVTRQLDDLRAQQLELFAHIDAAIGKLGEIDAWSREHLGMFAADLSILSRLLARLTDHRPAAPRMSDEVRPVEPIVDASSDEREHETIEEESGCEASPMLSQKGTLMNRETVVQAIREARQWFEAHEPSSPIPVLLRRAEQFVGKRYAEVVKAIPAELLLEWDQQN